MLIWEYPTAEAAEVRRIWANCVSESESYQGAYGTGGLIVSPLGTDLGDPIGKSVSILFSGGQFGLECGNWLLLVGFWIPKDFREEFLAWYKIERAPMLLESPLWEGFRFAEQKVTDGCQFYAMHNLSDTAALESAPSKFSGATPWFKRLARNSWFEGAAKRTLYRRFPA